MKEALVEIVRSAHKEILAVYDTSFDIDRKTDDSPITEADRRAHEVIVEGLNRLDGTIPILSEEAALATFEDRQSWQEYWLVDPLDGTKEFVKRNGEFTVNIALIENHRPALGVVGRPTEDLVFYGDTEQRNAWKLSTSSKERISCAEGDPVNIRSMQSRRRVDPRAEQFLANLEQETGVISRDFRGSSLKFLALAEGQADIYLQPGGTSEWDTGAAHAVLAAAGGRVMTFAGDELCYNTQSSVLNPPFIAVANTSPSWCKLLVKHLGVFQAA